MWKFIAKLKPGVFVLRRSLYFLCIAGIAVAAFFWGRQGSSQTKNREAGLGLKDYQPSSTGDYRQRVVAHIYGNIPITREELGEYLIARFGQERVEALVNRKIIEKACSEKGVYVSDGEVQAQLDQDLRALGKGGVSVKEFETKILRPYHKTLYEWREDVLRPRIALTKLAAPYVKVDEKDARDLFEARYGPMVKCRMIVLPKDWRGQWVKIWKEVHDDEEKFRDHASKQFMEVFRSKGGEAPPIHKHFGDPNLERAAFSLRVGEVSSLIELPDETAVILKCDGHIAARADVSYEKERAGLHQDAYRVKLEQKIPELMQQLRKAAAPVIHIREQVTLDEFERGGQKTLNPQAPTQNVPPTLPPQSQVDPSKLSGPPASALAKSSVDTTKPAEPIVPPGSFKLPDSPPAGAVPATSDSNFAPVPIGSGLNQPVSPVTGLPVVPSERPMGAPPYIMETPPIVPDGSGRK